MKLYRPRCGSEGADFIDRQCGDCVHDKTQRETGFDGCEIIVRSMAFDIDDDEYPKEWVVGKNGPMCTHYRYEDEDPTTGRCKNTADMFT